MNLEILFYKMFLCDLQCSSKVVGILTQKGCINLTVTLIVTCWNYVSTLSSNVPYLPLQSSPNMQCWGLIEGNEQKWRVQYCTGGVRALCKQPFAKCSNSFDEHSRPFPLFHAVSMQYNCICNFDIIKV